MFVNIGVMRGWIKKENVDSAHDTRLSIRAAGIYPEDDRPSAGGLRGGFCDDIRQDTTVRM